MRLKLCCAAVAVMLALAGCGDDSGSSSDGASGGDQAAAATRTTAPLVYVNRLPRPSNPGPHPGARVEQLVIRDVRVGRGPALAAGDTGAFDFIATIWDTGRPLDASWNRRGGPFETRIEKGAVIDGWWQGIPGMRVGGRRQILVPPALGFTQNLTEGVRGRPLYFDVVLLELRQALPGEAPTPDPNTPRVG